MHATSPDPDIDALATRHSDTPAEATAYRRLGRWLGPLVARRFPRRFGLFELAALGSIEWMRRHLAIINELEMLRRRHGVDTLLVLDFGGADGSLHRAIRTYGLERHYRIVTADIEAPTTQSPDVSFLLLDPEGEIPVGDAAFDVAVSSDVFEHIPATARGRWASELARVARFGEVHSVPADDVVGRWASTATDKEFARWHEQTFGGPERWTTEHLANGAPLIDELRSIFPSAQISGIVNCQVWQTTMRAKYGRKGPIHRMRFVALYAAKLRALERRPPYKNALIVVRR